MTAMKTHGSASKAYIRAIALLGAAVIVYSFYGVVNNSVSYQWLILAYLTVLTGAFTVKIPGVNSKFSVSDAFIFINMILFGTAAGVLTGALDGLVGSLRSATTSNRKQTIPFNTAVLGLSVFAAGEVFFRTFGRGPLAGGTSVHILEMALPLVLSALTYYLCNSLFVAGMISLADGGSAIHVWLQNLLATFGITFAGVAAGALLAFSVRSITPLTLLVVVPVLVTIYFINMIYLGSGTASDSTVGMNRLSVVHRPAYLRFHYFMVVLGLGFVALLLQNVLSEKIGYSWLIIAGLAGLAGFITVKIPGIKIRFSLGDTFVFANTILFGPAVGGITAALDGLAGSMRCKNKSRRWEYTLFNVAGMALSAYISGALFLQVSGQGSTFQQHALQTETIFLPALLLAVSYYLLNSMAVAVVVGLQAKVNAVQVWRENLLWSMTTHVACALGAVFVAAGLANMTPMVAIGVLIILAVIYLGFKTSAARVPQRMQLSEQGCGLKG